MDHFVFSDSRIEEDVQCAGQEKLPSREKNFGKVETMKKEKDISGTTEIRIVKAGTLSGLKAQLLKHGYCIKERERKKRERAFLI